VNQEREEVLIFAVGERHPNDPTRDLYPAVLAALRAGDFDDLLLAFGTPWVDPDVGVIE
jgi:hypothetical protein